MLRVSTKKKFIEIIQSVKGLCETLLHADTSEMLTVLAESQEAMIAIGEQLETEIAVLDNEEEKQKCLSVITRMEGLCETFYQLSQNLDKRELYCSAITESLTAILSEIEQLKASYQIVFFPYKADMWDSLESVWMACKSDPLFDCKVVPIPYNYCNTDTGEWECRYEIDRFPDYVPVISYKEYDLMEGADAAFIHNPYDERNYVTNVCSDYFSSNLKNYVKNLFYIPYYVTSGFISEEHKNMPVCKHADFLVVQSESFKDGLEAYGFGEKALVMGSPKLDRVIRLSKNKDNIPEEWKSILKDKKSLMLNTSLGVFLYDGEAYLQKIRYIFEVAKRRKDVVIIWRPHPLLQSSIESLRPELLEAYIELKEYFISERIGIFDETPDMMHTVAAVDGYIGETSSSVVNLFEAAGKPLFILNNYIYDRFPNEERRKLQLFDYIQLGNKCYGTSLMSNALLSWEKDGWNNIKIEALEAGGAKWGPALYTGMAVHEEDIFLNPVYAEKYCTYNTENRSFEATLESSEREILNNRFMVTYKNKVFYFSNSKKQILEYNTSSQTWKTYKEPIIALQKNITEQIYEDVCGYFVDEHKIWVTTLYSNRILCFDMSTAGYQIYEIGGPSACYSGIAKAEGLLYLSHADTGTIEVWDVKHKKIVRNYTMPVEFQTFRNIQGRCFANALLLFGHYLISVPGTANALVRIDLQTDEVSVLAKEFFADILEPANGHKTQVHGAVGFAKMLDDKTLLMQKRRDASMLELNVQTGEYQVHHPQLAEGELEKLLDGEDGFEKSYTNGEFARRESRYFSFEGFLDDLEQERFGDAMKRQKEEMQTMAVNLDGTCGEKVHAFMIDLLEMAGD